MEISRLFLSEWSLPRGGDRGVKEEGEEEEAGERHRQKGTHGKQKQEGGGWVLMTMTETDRNKMPVAEKRDSTTGDFPERSALFFFNLLHCLYVCRATAARVVAQVGL